MADVAASGGSGACPIFATLPPLAKKGTSTVLGPMIPSLRGAQVQDKRHCALRIYQGRVIRTGYSDSDPWSGPAVTPYPNSSNQGRHRRPVSEAAPMVPVGLAVVAEAH